MPGIQVGFGCAPVVVALVLLLSAVLAFLLYRYTVPPTSRLTRIVLGLLRGTALFLLLVLLCDPVVRFVRTSTIPPTLAVVVDNTASVALRDRTGSRETTLRSALSSPALDHTPNNANVRFYRFSTSLHPLGSVSADSLRLDDEGTDLSGALQSLASERQRQNIQAALLLTDGAYTRGQNPVYLADGYPIPLFPVPIGDSTEQKDVAVTRIASNSTVYAGIQTPVDATVKSTGYARQPLEITLMNGSTVLDRVSITTEAGSHEYAVQLRYVPQGEGTQKFSVRVSSLPGELTTRNNTRSFTTRVRKSKLLIIVIAGTPSPDLSLLRQTLAEEPDFDVRSFTQNPTSGYYEGQLPATALDSSDCIVLVDFPTARTSAQSLELVRNQFSVRKKPCLFISGRTLDYARLNLLGSAIPFTADAIAPAEQEIFFAPVPSERTHPLLHPQPDQSTSAWEKLPPVFRARTIIRPRPGTRVLGTAVQQRVVLPDPLMLTRTIDKQKSLALTCYGIWRWRLMAQGSPETATLFSSFLTTSVKWLTTPEESRALIVTPERQAFSRGEPIIFQGQAYDQTLKPLDNAQVVVRAHRDTATAETVLRSIGNGRYEGSMGGLSEGTYTFRAVARTDGRDFAADSGRFSVGGLEEEFIDTRMNPHLLRTLAEKSGGHMLPPEQIDSLTSALAAIPTFAPRVETLTTTLDVRTWYYFAGLIILLLAVEWFIRRRTGML